MSAKTRLKTQPVFQKLSSSLNLLYPYPPHTLDALTMAQKVLLSPEIPCYFRDGLRDVACIDMQDVDRAFLWQERDHSLELNLSPVYQRCFLYMQAPDFIYDSETEKGKRWDRQELAWGVQYVSLQLPSTSDAYFFTREFMDLPEEQPLWFEQVHWILSIGLYLEVPDGKYVRCVGPVITGNLLIDASGSIVRNEYGARQVEYNLIHDNIEDVIYWYLGKPLAPSSKPGARHEVTAAIIEHFTLNIYLSLLGYASLNDPRTQLLPNKIYPFCPIENDIFRRHGQSFPRHLSLTGQQLLLQVAPLPGDDLLDNIPFV
ncbi:hypothetical protein KDH_65560 [Dictyobacter sp. S3.2.2.5]|uniref:Uncharacterized protein n=2 Tax=Dictyobacter halimunensis TaxID=3026934 RepID=A0ABQ6G0V9_9CHLR|nr:hypothetical protein KDH_65560 [Dictyobacter sp. S3.2.2.5]